jgi:hypothetical protein
MNVNVANQLEQTALTNPLEAMRTLESIADVHLTILHNDVPPTECASPIDDVLKFLGTSANQELTADRTAFVIPSLQTYMKPSKHFAVDAHGRITHVSRRGLHLIAKDLATPESNVVFSSLLGATNIVLSAVAV